MPDTLDAGDLGTAYPVIIEDRFSQRRRKSVEQLLQLYAQGALDLSSAADWCISKSQGYLDFSPEAYRINEEGPTSFVSGLAWPLGGERISRIEVSCGAVIDGISLFCGTSSGEERRLGSWGSIRRPSEVQSFEIEPGDHLRTLRGNWGRTPDYGSWVAQLQFVTLRNHASKWYGIRQAAPSRDFDITAPDEHVIVGLHGQATDRGVQGIGALVARRTSRYRILDGTSDSSSESPE